MFALLFLFAGRNESKRSRSVGLVQVTSGVVGVMAAVLRLDW